MWNHKRGFDLHLEQIPYNTGMEKAQLYLVWTTGPFFGALYEFVRLWLTCFYSYYYYCYYYLLLIIIIFIVIVIVVVIVIVIVIVIGIVIVCGSRALLSPC